VDEKFENPLVAFTNQDHLAWLNLEISYAAFTPAGLTTR